MLGVLYTALGAFTFALNNVTMRRGVVTGSVLQGMAPAHADRECVPEPVAAAALFGRCNQGAAFAETARASRS